MTGHPLPSHLRAESQWGSPKTMHHLGSLRKGYLSMPGHHKALHCLGISPDCLSRNWESVDDNDQHLHCWSVGPGEGVKYSSRAGCLPMTRWFHKLSLFFHSLFSNVRPERHSNISCTGKWKETSIVPNLRTKSQRNINISFQKYR